MNTQLSLKDSKLFALVITILILSAISIRSNITVTNIDYKTTATNGTNSFQSKSVFSNPSWDNSTRFIHNDNLITLSN